MGGKVDVEDLPRSGAVANVAEHAALASVEVVEGEADEAGEEAQDEGAEAEGHQGPLRGGED